MFALDMTIIIEDAKRPAVIMGRQASSVPSLSVMWVSWTDNLICVSFQFQHCVMVCDNDRRVKEVTHFSKTND